MNYLTSWTRHEGIEAAAKRSKAQKTHIDLAHDIIQGDFAHDAALKDAAAGPADVCDATTTVSTHAAGVSGTSSNGLRPCGIAGDDAVLTIFDSQTMEAAPAKIATTQPNAWWSSNLRCLANLDRLASLKGGDFAGSTTSGTLCD
jgi:hypothetical protein